MNDPLAWLDDALADLDRRGLRRTLAARLGPCSPTLRVGQGSGQLPANPQSLVNFGSNDYLGLAADPRIAAAVREAIEKYGWGSGASPLVTGRSDLHAELERKLAEFEGTDAALLFPSGYAANVGTITALVGKGDAIYSDELNHASIIDGCRLSGAEVHVYPNQFFATTRKDDLHHLAKLLNDGRQYRRRLIVTDTIFSMHGTYAQLLGLARLADEFGAILMVDEAHATGVLGERGGGLCEAAAGGDRVNVRVGTLSKALGSHGGFVAGSKRLIDWLANRARPYVFSTAAPVAAAAAAMTALEIVRNEPQRRKRLDERCVELHHRLVLQGTIKPTSPTQIIPVILGDASRTMAAAAELRHRGFFVPGIRPPSVPEGQSLLRISLTAMHTQQQLDDLVAALAEVVR